MVRKLLFAQQKPLYLIGGIAGSLTGIIMLLISVQLYLDFDRLINGSGDLNQPQYFVINKEVSVLNTLFGGQKGFAEEEIKTLKEIKGVMDIAPLTPSHFKVGLSMGEDGFQGIPGMYTDLFFEAVPDEFMDVRSDEWKWSNKDSLIPIVVPRDYINLYNFGFAPTQNLPPLTEDMIGMATFKVTLTTSEGRIVYRGKIVGFTERINTILAPKSFIDFANKEFAGVEPGQYPSNRVIIRCEGPATPQLVSYFEDNGYETSEESLRNSKYNSVLNLIMNICVGIGMVIIFLSLMIFLLYSQLIIAKSSYEIQTLTFIGHSPQQLIMTYAKYYMLVFTAMVVTGIVATWVIKWLVSGMAKKYGFALLGGMDSLVLVLALVVLGLFLVFNYLSIRKNVIRLAKNR